MAELLGKGSRPCTRKKLGIGWQWGKWTDFMECFLVIEIVRHRTHYQELFRKV